MAELITTLLQGLMLPGKLLQDMAVAVVSGEEKKDKSKKQEFREFCQKTWETEGTVLGSGMFGEVGIVCKRGTEDCNYVLKVQENTSIFENEESILYILNRLPESDRIAPYLYDSWTCDQKGFLVMDKLDGDLMDVPVTDTVVEKVRRLLDVLHEQRIAMIDLSRSNVLYKGQQFYLSDFGLAVDYSQVNDEYKRRVYVEPGEMTFPEAVAFDLHTLYREKCNRCFHE